MSTYKDQTTQVMAMMWNVTEHTIFLRSLAVICNFSHCEDNRQSRSEGCGGESGLSAPPPFPNEMNFPQYPVLLFKPFGFNQVPGMGILSTANVLCNDKQLGWRGATNQTSSPLPAPSCKGTAAA